MPCAQGKAVKVCLTPLTYAEILQSLATSRYRDGGRFLKGKSGMIFLCMRVSKIIF